MRSAFGQTHSAFGQTRRLSKRALLSQVAPISHVGSSKPS